ncbi:MAG: hypothetical protein ACRESZ_04490 [Methylococcales bacterium]
MRKVVELQTGLSILEYRIVGRMPEGRSANHSAESQSNAQTTPTLTKTFSVMGRFPSGGTRR